MCFTQKFKMAAKMAGKQFLRKVASRLCNYPVGQKFCWKLLYLNVCQITFFLFYAEIQDGCQKWQESDF